MSFEHYKNRNVGQDGYYMVDIEDYPTTGMEKFKRVVKRTFKGELFVGLWVVLREMIKFDIHTVQYPKEKLPIGPRYRAVHEMQRLWESGTERCIGCGLCEKICISDCIRMDTKIDENSRKEVSEYTINLGRCIFCGYCAEVCPELAIVHGGRYENVSEQRAHYTTFEDMLTPIDSARIEARVKEAQKEVAPKVESETSNQLWDKLDTPSVHVKVNNGSTPTQKEYQGFGAITPHEDERVKKTPLAY